MCVIACVLLIVLWVRSYSRVDELWGPVGGSKYIYAWSVVGRLSLNIVPCWRPDELRVNYASERFQDIGLSTKQEILNVFNSKIWLPTSLMVAAFATVGALPWVRYLRWRFTLRTLLIVTTLVAVVLGLIVWLSS